MRPQTRRGQQILTEQLDSARGLLRQVRRVFLNSLQNREDYAAGPIASPFLGITGPCMVSAHATPQAKLCQSNNTYSEPSACQVTSAMDGAADKHGNRGRKGDAPKVAAIFVHAGAGYHSTTNEHMHLGACDKAAKIAMKVLKAGGTAVDAVEAAIKVLEDNEITNAGFGSNLTIDGVVEGDATIVDHCGRSGACGATAQIKNPIHLARTILEASNKPLSLRRVPPNLLVAQGATDFAYEQGIPIVHFDLLVSRNARDRYLRWREDLLRAEGRITTSSNHSQSQEVDLESEAQYQIKQRRDHTNAILKSTWNEGQPDSITQTQSSDNAQSSHFCPTYHRRSPSPTSLSQDSAYLNAGPAKRPRYTHLSSDPVVRTHLLLGPHSSGNDVKKSPPNVAVTLGETARAEHVRPRSSDGHETPTSTGHDSTARASLAAGGADPPLKDRSSDSRSKNDEDLITDTVGAIAIDMYGHIAAGSSSGGIGMKHRGRVGPAALVGVGSAVIPEDQYDEDGISVAAVTSGTGEHMATTMASQKCADRLYHNTRRGTGGIDIVATEEEAMESFVQADFMGHPGVSGSSSLGAIGVMAVKKTAYGYFLQFAHNTDSFALASMHSSEKAPKCVMSRLGKHSAVVQGGRKIRID